MHAYAILILRSIKVITNLILNGIRERLTHARDNKLFRKLPTTYNLG